eukprot:9055716-Alexandrium_andersonii.AAC.1
MRPLYTSEGNSFDYVAVAVRHAAAVEILARRGPPARRALPGTPCSARARAPARGCDWGTGAPPGSLTLGAFSGS